MIILGLTGSIGMGKSTAAEQLRSLGLPVFDADAAVHDLYRDAQVQMALHALLPKGAEYPVTRSIMRQAILRDESLLPKLESVLHPLVRAREKEFLQSCRDQGFKIAVLDIPLLYETGEQNRCDYIAVVTAPKFIQYWRVLRRPTMSLKKLRAILARQMPDAEKRRRADFVVHTAWGRAHSLRQWRRILKGIGDRR